MGTAQRAAVYGGLSPLERRIRGKFMETIQIGKNIKIRMLMHVSPYTDMAGQSGLAFILRARPETKLLRGHTYSAVCNKHGAIAARCDNGELLGVKPGEFEFISAPEWVLLKHGITPSQEC